MGRLENKICIVTAAAQGIGRATAMEFKKQGGIIYATDINVEKLNELTEFGIFFYMIKA
jgi:NAD(P)-dependent dehydrogenase (short-subunit alcohol dehydrogenase family)